MFSTVCALISAATFGVASPVANTSPSWSPDGKWVAFASNRGAEWDIWKTDGVRTLRVARNGTDPAWSPKGGAIVFVTQRLRAPSVFVTTPTVPRRLVYYAFDPVWSRDGKRLAFTAPTDGCSRGNGIWTSRADGGGKRLVVESLDEFTDYVTPAWSPDGKRLAYAIPTTDQGDTGLAIVSLRTLGTAYAFRGDALSPSWSPDGRRIVFVQPTGGGYGPMVVLDLRTHRARRLTGVVAAEPAWSPRGRRIAFSGRSEDGSSELYLVDPDGSHLTRLTKPTAG